MNWPEADKFAKINYGITPSSFSTVEWMRGVELLVPLYQRLFVWEEEQINQLLEDLEQAFHTNTPYFIGTLTVFRRDHEQQNKWELVDGQQRMTVLTLLGAAFSHRTNQDSLWAPFIVKGDGKDSRIQYFARPHDQEDLRKIWTEGFNPSGGIANPNMRRFNDVFERFLNRPREGQPFLKDLSKFSTFIYENTTVLVAFLPDSYKLKDLNLYFEKMNAGGKQLEAHEILKGRYFGPYSSLWNAIADGSKAFKSEDDEEINLSDLTLESLLSNSDEFSDKDEPDTENVTSDSTRLVMSFPVFLLHSLSICIPTAKTEIIEEGFWEPKHLLSTFKKAEAWWKENRKDQSFAETFVKVMQEYRKWMDRNIIHIEDDRPVPPYQQSDDQADRYTPKPIWQFQSMLHVSGSERQGWVLDAYQEFLQNQSPEKGEEEFLATLKQQDADRHPFNFGDDELSAFSYGQIDRYWFWKLDYILWEKALKKEQLGELNDVQASAVKFYIFRRNRSIEHLHPQTSDMTWDEKHLHSFGNLAMISASFNSQQSNDSVGTKFGRMTDKIARNELESIKLLLMFVAAKGEDVQWTPEASIEHGQKMINILKDYYSATPVAVQTVC